MVSTSTREPYPNQKKGYECAPQLRFWKLTRYESSASLVAYETLSICHRHPLHRRSYPTSTPFLLWDVLAENTSRYTPPREDRSSSSTSMGRFSPLYGFCISVSRCDLISCCPADLRALACFASPILSPFFAGARVIQPRHRPVSCPMS